MDSSDDELFNEAHIPDSIFRTEIQSENFQEGQNTSEFRKHDSWQSANNDLLSQCSFSGACSSTQVDIQCQPSLTGPSSTVTSDPNSGWIQKYHQFIIECQMDENNFDKMDAIMLQLTYEYPNDVELDDGEALNNAIEQEFVAIQNRLDEVDAIHAEYYGRDHSIVVSYNELDDDYIVAPDMDWMGITFED